MRTQASGKTHALSQLRNKCSILTDLALFFPHGRLQPFQERKFLTGLSLLLWLTRSRAEDGAHVSAGGRRPGPVAGGTGSLQSSGGAACWPRERAHRSARSGWCPRARPRGCPPAGRQNATGRGTRGSRPRPAGPPEWASASAIHGRASISLSLVLQHVLGLSVHHLSVSGKAGPGCPLRQSGS